MKISEENKEEIIIAYLLGEMKEVEDVEAWIAASEENRNFYLSIEKIWKASFDHSQKFDVDAAWRKIDTKISRKRNYTWIAVAAIVVMLFSPFLYLQNTVNEIELSSFEHILADTLIDGTIITLNTESHIRYNDDFNEGHRTLSLEGEAFFDVHRDTSQKFIIHLGESEVQVLGTSFNIRSFPKEESISVYVSSGIVLFKYEGKDPDQKKLSIELRAGDKVSYNKLTKEIEKHSANEMNQIDLQWMDKNLVFDGVDLARVAAVLEAVYDVKIQFDTEASKACPLTAQFENDDVEDILSVIAASFNLTIENEGENYLLKGLACE